MEIKDYNVTINRWKNVFDQKIKNDLRTYDNIRKTATDNAQKMEFPNKDFFSKCDQIRNFMRNQSHLLKKSIMENFFFCVVRSR